jgi:hypothetical protein
MLLITLSEFVICFPSTVEYTGPKVVSAGKQSPPLPYFLCDKSFSKSVNWTVIVYLHVLCLFFIKSLLHLEQCACNDGNGGDCFLAETTSGPVYIFKDIHVQITMEITRFARSFLALNFIVNQCSTYLLINEYYEKTNIKFSSCIYDVTSLALDGM